MSAYIVEDKTINTIVTALHMALRNDPWLSEDLKELGFDPDINGWEQKLAQAMLHLNVSAVDQRYQMFNNEKVFDFRLEIHATAVQKIKSLKCWLYQCSEGDVPEETLFKFFDNVFLRYLMEQVIYRLPEYDVAEWA